MNCELCGTVHTGPCYSEWRDEWRQQREIERYIMHFTGVDRQCGKTFWVTPKPTPEITHGN